MTLKFLNRVRMSVTGTAGSGALTVNLPAAGGQSLTDAGLAFGDTTAYVIEDGSPVGTDWEIGIGTWHSNGTFSRDTVTQSSVGGTTKINATSTAILSATFRAQDLVTGLSQLTDVDVSGVTDGQLLSWNAGAGKWVPVVARGSGPGPQLVQYGTVQSSASGTHSVTLATAPTQQNYLIAIGQGGGVSALGVYTPGFTLVGSDCDFLAGINDQYAPGWGIRAVRFGDSATWQIGSGNAHHFNGVLAEVSGLDISRLAPGLMARIGTFGSVETLVDALAVINALTLLFEAQGTGALTLTNPGTIQFNNDDSTDRLVFAYNTSAGGFNGISGYTSSSNRVLALNLPGF